MSKLNRRGRMLRSDGAALPNESCKRGRRPEYLDLFLGHCLEPQNAFLSPDAQVNTSSTSETSAPADTSTHTEEAARHADQAEKYAQVTSDILSNFAKHFASFMDPFNVTDASLPPKAPEKQTRETEPTPRPAHVADQENTAASALTTKLTSAEVPTNELNPRSLAERLVEVAPVTPTLPEIVSNSQTTTATPSLNTSAATLPPKSPATVPDWTLVDDKGNADDDSTSLPSAPSGTTPKISPTASITSNASIPLTFAKLADDLQRHMDADLAAEHAAAATPVTRSYATNIPEHLSKYFFEYDTFYIPNKLYK